MPRPTDFPPVSRVPYFPSKHKRSNIGVFAALIAFPSLTSEIPHPSRMIKATSINTTSRGYTTIHRCNLPPCFNHRSIIYLHVTLPSSLPHRLKNFLDSLPTMEYYSDDTNESASSIWKLLNPLKNEKGKAILQPIDSKLYIKTFPIRDAPSIEPPFPTQNAVDSGTLYAPFTNGMSLAYSRAVMATEPTDKKLHSSDTVTMCYHTSDLLAPDLCSDLFNIYDSPDNTMIMTKLSDPPSENEILESVLHATALYLSEGSHALKWANSVKDILILDGPIFPVALLGWHHVNPSLQNLLSANGPSRRALKAYIELIDSFVKPIIAGEPSPPLIGFVKTPRSTTIKSIFNRRPSEMNSFIFLKE